MSDISSPTPGGSSFCRRRCSWTFDIRAAVYTPKAPRLQTPLSPPPCCHNSAFRTFPHTLCLTRHAIHVLQPWDTLKPIFYTAI